VQIFTAPNVSIEFENITLSVTNGLNGLMRRWTLDVFGVAIKESPIKNLIGVRKVKSNGPKDIVAKSREFKQLSFRLYIIFHKLGMTESCTYLT